MLYFRFGLLLALATLTSCVGLTKYAIYGSYKYAPVAANETPATISYMAAGYPYAVQLRYINNQQVLGSSLEGAVPETARLKVSPGNTDFVLRLSAPQTISKDIDAQIYIKSGESYNIVSGQNTVSITDSSQRNVFSMSFSHKRNGRTINQIEM